MTIENEQNSQENVKLEHKLAENILNEVDKVVSEIYDIINLKQKTIEDKSGKIKQLVNLKGKVKKTIIRLGGYDVSEMPNDYPGAPIAIVLILAYNFIKKLANEDLEKLSYRVNSIEQLIKILEEKNDGI